MASYVLSTGGNKAISAIADAMQKYASGPKIKVGFLANATYPDGTPVAMIAMIQEFGATINRAAGDVTIYRKVNAAGTEFLKGGRFVKRTQSNFSSTHKHEAYTINIPPRPFFRTMIAQNQASWAPELARLIKSGIAPMDALRTLGQIMSGQLRASIIAMNTPPNAPSTIQKKKAAKPLVDTGHMRNSVDFEVTIK